MHRRALITGATGFVGTHLVEHLHSDGWGIRALVRGSSDTRRLQALGAERFEGSLGTPEVIRAACAGAEVVFHLAAVTGLRREKAFARANVEGTRNVVEALLGAEPRPRRLVYLSSYAACGPAEEGHPRRMDEPPAPITAYGRTKLAGEEIVRTLGDAGVEVVILRAPAVYGPGDHALLPYFQLVRRALAPAPTGGERRLHLIFAPDLARALARAAEGPVGTFAVAEPVEHTWTELTRSIAKALGRRPLRIPVPQALVRAAAAVAEGVGSRLGLEVSLTREKAREMLAPAWVCELSGSEAFLPPEEVTPLQEGMARTVEWYQREGWL